MAVAGLLATTVTGLAIPSPHPEAEPEAIAEPEALPDITSDLTDAALIKTSSLSWAADTRIVSKFLDDIAGKKFKSQKNYLKAAQAALAAEEAEWAHKETIADYLLNNPVCQAAIAR